MKLKFLLLVTLLGVSGFVSAQSLKPLSTFIADGSPDAAKVSYVMARCSALYMNFQTITEDSNPELGKKYQAASLEALYKFVEISELANKKKNSNYIPPKDIAAKATGTVSNISKMYKPLLEQSYASTGSYLSNPLIMGDLEVCQQLVKGK
jgi:hypothetical protein